MDAGVGTTLFGSFERWTFIIIERTLLFWYTIVCQRYYLLRCSSLLMETTELKRMQFIASIYCEEYITCLLRKNQADLSVFQDTSVVYISHVVLHEIIRSLFQTLRSIFGPWREYFIYFMFFQLHKTSFQWSNATWAMLKWNVMKIQVLKILHFLLWYSNQYFPCSVKERPGHFVESHGANFYKTLFVVVRKEQNNSSIIILEWNVSVSRSSNLEIFMWQTFI